MAKVLSLHPFLCRYECPTCGHEWVSWISKGREVTPAICPKCAKLGSWAQPEFARLAKETVPG